MQCLNKFFISTNFPLTNSPNSRSKTPSFHPKLRSHKIRCDVIASNKAVSLPPNVKAITSTSNPFVKHCVKLRQSSSYRHFHGSLLVVGTTPLRILISRTIEGNISFHKTVSERPIIQCLFVLDNCCVPEEIDDEAIHVVQVSSEVIKKISGVQSVDCVELVALVRIPSTFQNVSSSIHDVDCHALFSFPNRILVLDGIQDPGNLGTLVRSATAFRWDGVFLLPGCCDPFNDKALRVCRGACFQIPIVSGTWTHVRALSEGFQMKMLAGHPGTSHGPNTAIRLSKAFADSVAGSPLCLVLGSEGAGLSEHSRSACELVSIPMAGEFESLNVSIAEGILMYMLQHESSKPF